MGNKLTHFDPFGGIDTFFRDFSLRPAWRDFDVEPRIKMDVTESDDAYTVKADMPGVKKEDIKIDIEGNRVSISAESRKESEEKKGETVVRSERYFGQQSRSFLLGSEIDDTTAQATYRDGVLELKLPKKKGDSGARKVTVS